MLPAPSLRFFCRVAAATVFSVIAFATSSAAQSTTVAWNANPEADLAGYYVDYGTVAGSPTTTIDVGNTTQRTFSGLQAGITYYFRVRAYNTSAMVSPASLEVSYTAPVPTPAPTLTSVSPTSGPAGGGTVITLTGTNFVAGATVRVNSVLATSITLLSSTQLRATTPAGTAGARSVQVTNPDGQAAVLSSAFTYVAAPAVTSVSPTGGPLAGGTTITVTGSNFTTGAVVRVGGTLATGITLLSSTQVRAVTPAGAAGAQTIQVTNLDGQAGSLAGAFTYRAAPTVTSVSPNSGPTAGGTVVTVNGTGFSSGVSVRVGGAAATAVSLLSSTQVRATTPAGTAGAQTVQVTNGDGQSGSLAGAFTYTATVSPTLTAVTPASGPTAGGTTISLTGTNFAAGATVTVGGATATGVSVVSATSMTAVTPAGTAGARDVRVTLTNGQSATRASAFTYTAPVTPTLSAIAPVHGPAAGGTAVTLTGSNFAAGAVVTVGGTAAANVVVVNATTITAVTPAGTAGARDVRIALSGGTSAALTGGFTYTSSSGTDDDGDGLLTEWETRFGTNPNSAVGPDGASGDPDGDGLTNADEQAAGSHPRGTHARYFAEGASNGFFSTRFAIANPQAAAARVLLTFVDANGATTRHYVPVPARARASVDAAAIAELSGASFATKLEADQVVVIDRMMSWSGALGYGSHMETAVEQPSTTWYLAEGATHGSFDLFYLVQNPSTAAASVNVRFIRPSGAPITKLYTVPAGSRFTIWVDQEDPALAASDVSAEVTASVPVIVERSMYLNTSAVAFKGGHNSAGATAPSTSWFLAEGATGKFFTMFVLLANPGASTANVRITYLKPSGPPIVKDYTVPGNSRRTLNVALEHGSLGSTSVSAKVESTNGVPIIVERTMWWPGSLTGWTEGHNSFGATRTAPRWVVAEGQQGGPQGVSTFVLIANTSAAAASVRVTLLKESGAEEAQTYTVPANSRYTVGAGNFAGADGQRVSFLVESLNPTTAGGLVVERATYWNVGAEQWGSGSNSAGAIIP